MLHLVGLGIAIGAKVIGAKVLAAHSAHALATQGALVVHHPLAEATHVAIHHGLSAAAADYHGPLVNTVATGAAPGWPSTPTNLLEGMGAIAVLGTKQVISRQAWHTVQEVWSTCSSRPS